MLACFYPADGEDLTSFLHVQLMRIINELAKVNANDLVQVVHFVLRNCRGGDISDENVWLADELMRCLWTNNRYQEHFGTSS